MLLFGFPGRVEGCTLPVVVTAHIKLGTWLVRSLFATFGVPQRAISDDGTAFESDVIPTFYEENGIQAVASATYHRTTNGQVKCYLAELKKALL